MSASNQREEQVIVAEELAAAHEIDTGKLHRQTKPMPRVTPDKFWEGELINQFALLESIRAKLESDEVRSSSLLALEQLAALVSECNNFTEIHYASNDYAEMVPLLALTGDFHSTVAKSREMLEGQSAWFGWFRKKVDEAELNVQLRQVAALTAEVLKAYFDLFSLRFTNMDNVARWKETGKVFLDDLRGMLGLPVSVVLKTPKKKN
jgi:hypothetical protein